MQEYRSIIVKKCINCLIYIAMFFSPMCAKGLSFDTPIGNLSITRISLFLICFLYVISKVAYGENSGLKYYSNHYTTYNILFLFLWAVYALITLFWVRDINRWVKTNFFLIIGLFSTIIICDQFDDFSQIICSLKSLSTGISVQALIGWYEVFTKDYKFMRMTETNIKAYKLNSEIGVPMAMSGNPNDFATILLLGIFIGIVCYRTANTVTGRMFFGLGLISKLLLLLLSTSRANMLGLFFAFIVFFVISNRKRKTLFITICIIIVLLLTGVLQYALGRVSFMLTWNDNSSETVRTNLMRNGFEILLRTFFMGTGPGQIELWMADNMPYQTMGVYNIHNLWLEILVGYGPIVFIGFIKYYFSFIIGELSDYQKDIDKQYKLVSICFCLFHIALIIGSISASSLLTTGEWIWLFWAVATSSFILISKDISKTKVDFLQGSKYIKW